MNITKEQFVSAINSMQEQRQVDHDCGDAFSVILPSDYVSGYDNSRLYDAIIELLIGLTGDDPNESWIEYFIWELEFGEKYTPGSIKYLDGREIDMSTSEKLYDFLLGEQK